MKFEWKRQGKTLDRLENEATESAEEVVKSFLELKIQLRLLKSRYAKFLNTLSQMIVTLF